MFYSKQLCSNWIPLPISGTMLASEPFVMGQRISNLNLRQETGMRNGRVTRGWIGCLWVFAWVLMPHTADVLAATNRTKTVVVPGVHAHQGVPPGAADVLCDLLLEALLNRHAVRALGPSDIRAILSAEQQKTLLGCQDESCFADLAGALGADWLVAGTVGMLGDLFVLSLQLIDPNKAQVAARASATVKDLSQAPEFIGPLTDKLLGSRPRARSQPSVLSTEPKRPAHKNWDRSEFCKRLRDYFKQLTKQPYSDDLVEQRRQLLEDLALTPMEPIFVRKSSCFWETQPRATSKISHQWNCSTDATQSFDAQKRFFEVMRFLNQIELLKHAYLRALEMEKNGSGPRLRELPFEVKQAKVPVPEATHAVMAYWDAYPQRYAMVQKTVELIVKGDQKAFMALFAKDMKPTRREALWKKVTSYLSQGYRLDATPKFVLSVSDVEYNAKTLADKGQFIISLRRSRDNACSGERVYMKQIGQAWKIVRW